MDPKTAGSAPETWQLLTTVCSALIVLAIYNLRFHPLAAYPGPWYRAAFAAPNMWFLFNGTSLQRTRALHDRYGSVVRIAPDFLSYNNFEGWKDIYGYGLDKEQVPKDPKRFPFLGEACNIIMSSDADHARIRKHLGHAFSDMALRGQEILLTKYFDYLIERLRDQLDESATAIVDMMDWYNFVTFDIISEMCLGESFGALRTGDHASYVKDLFAGIKFYRWIYAAQEYPLVKTLLAMLMRLPAFRKQQGVHFLYTESRTLKRMEKGQTDRNDFVTYILRHDDQKGMTTKEITETAAILMTAGAETSATAMAGATYYLLSNPAAYERVRDEVRSTFQSQDEVRLSTVGRLPYLNAVIEEVLRVYPPAAGNFQRRTVQGIVVDGKFVPPNTSIGVHQWSTYRSVHNFADPDDFVPERWLADPPAAYVGDKRRAMMPFAYGPRNCVGRSLAYFEMRSLLCRMLLNFDLELMPASVGWAERQRFHILWEKGPLTVRLRDRAGTPTPPADISRGHEGRLTSL